MKQPDHRPWKVLNSEYLAHEPWFTVRREAVELPGGARIPSYYVLEYPDWVNIIARTDDGRFLLIDQYRHGLGRTSYEIVAGVRDPQDATPLDAARRELYEETGYGGGVECGAHCGYHLRDADLMIEIIHPETGESVPNGTWGEVVFSAFARKGMPLLHYRTGDIGRFCPDACGCGGVLPRLDKVMGRIENTIFLHNGDAISIHQLDEVLFALDGVHDYAAKLKQNPEATLSLTIEGDADPDMITEFIHKKWSGLEIRVNSGIVERKRKRSIVREK